MAFPLHVSREVERLFEEMIQRPWDICREINGWDPPMDLYETDDAFILEADLPGITCGDIQLTIQDGHLVLRGSRSVEKRFTGGRFHIMERSAGHFVRVLELPEAVDREAVQSECRDGVLKVVLPKAKRACHDADR